MATVDIPDAPAPEPSGPESRLGPIGRARASVEAIESELAIAEGQAKVEPVTAETWQEIERDRERSALPA